MVKLFMRWFFNWVLFSGTKFFFGIGQGPSQREKDIFGLLQGMATTEFGAGSKAVSQGTGFWSDILSGDPTKMAAAIAPETKVIQGQAQQKKKQATEFGTRSGGTAATNAAIDTNATAAIQDLVNRLRPQAARELTTVGLSEEGLASGNAGMAFNAAEVMQQQSAKKWGDIFRSIALIASGALGGYAIGGTLLSTAGGAAGGAAAEGVSG